MEKKAFAIALAALLACCFMAGCTKSTSEPTGTPSSAASSNQPPKPAKTKKKSPKPKVIAADDVPSVKTGQLVKVTGELSTAMPNSRVDGSDDYSDIALNLQASDGTTYDVFAFETKASTDDIGASYPDIDMGTLYNSGNTKYNVTLEGKVHTVNYGDESGELLGFELDEAKIVGATPA